MRSHTMANNLILSIVYKKLSSEVESTKSWNNSIWGSGHTSKACEQSVSGRFTTQHSSLFLWQPLIAPLLLTRFLTTPLHFRSTHCSHAVLDVVTDGIGAHYVFVNIFQEVISNDLSRLLSANDFYRLMLYISQVFAVAQNLSVRPAVCLSVTLVYCIQTAEDIVKLLSRPGSPIILVFDPECWYPIPRETFQWGAKYKGWVGKICSFPLKSPFI